MNIEAIKYTLNLLKPNNQLYEIRILRDNVIISGYFRGTDHLEEAFKTINLNGANVFYTLQAIEEGCYSRKQHECFRQVKSGETTSDNDIIGYNWLLIDLDPCRRTGISSTDEELGKAKAIAPKIIKYMDETGFERPVVAMSGNGVHLLYAIELANNNDNKKLIEKCLKALALMFSDNEVDIDQKVFNPARISKLYGTMAQKGADTEDRPHRMSKIVSIPEEIKATEKSIIQKLANTLPEEVVQIKKNNHSNFDLDDWIYEHGIKIRNTNRWNDATKYVLEECPFDSTHKAPDSCLIKMPNGAIAFKCLHNSCNGRTWKDFRLLYEPDAYDDKDSDRIDAGWKEYKAYNRNRTDIQYEPLIEETAEEPMFETIQEILNKPKEERVCIPTGYLDLDKNLGGGLAKGEISVVSGLRSAAKSTWLSQVMLNAVDRGYTVICYSGELKDKRFADWLICQAAGLEYIDKSRKFINYGTVKEETKQKIGEWLGTKLFLYNNNYGNNFSSIATRLQKEIKERKADLVIIDNMMILDLSGVSRSVKDDKYDLQKLFIESLKNLSILCNSHIVFVAHPRKAQGFLRLDDISGTGNIGNLVDNAFIIHRNNDDFKRLSQQMFRWKESHVAYSGTNVIEIAKEREFGNQDIFIPLWYEQYTRRLLNKENEHIVYGWNTDDGFITEDEEDIPFE